MAPALADMDAREVERLLGELGANASADLLRAIKTLEPDPDPDPDAMFPLVADLLEIGDGNASQEDVDVDDAGRCKERQLELEKRCEALRRRLRLQQARATGRHAAEQTFEAFRRAGKISSPSKAAVRAFVDRLRSSVALPDDKAKKTHIASPAPNLASTAAALRTQLTVVERSADSDATESSSGAESDDEGVQYNNPHQNQMPLTKRTLWKWVHERAAVAYRWTWLQAQIQELEYKIRQHNDLHRRLRAAKGTSLLCEPSGYSGPLPGETMQETVEVDSCARVRPLNQAVFRKRKLLQMHNLHTAAEKAAKPSNIRCICQWPLSGCAVCTGRALPMHPLPVSSTLTKRERLALVDPAFHPVLSSEKDVSASIQYSALMKDPQWQQRSTHNSLMPIKGNVTPNKIPQPSNKLPILPIKSHSKKKKRSKSKRRPNDAPSEFSRALLTKRRTSLVEDGVFPFDQGPHPSGSNSPVPSPSEHNRHRPRERIDRTRLNSSYDIDNIVIPHSIAASTKLEILQYKEIITPKWRIVEEDLQTPNNGIIKKIPALNSSEVKDNDVEDITETTIISRHERCEALEKGKYLQKRKSSRRHHSRSGTGSNPPLTPSETPPHTPATIVDETSMHSESGLSISTPVTQSTFILTSVANVSNNTNTITTTSTTSITTTTTTNQPIQPVIQDSVSLPSNTISVQCAPITNKRRSTLPTDEIEFVPPFSPRSFPLSDEVYTSLLLDIPDNHPLSNSENENNHIRPSGLCNNGSDSESNSALTYNSARDNCVMEVGENLTLDPASESDADSYSVPPEEDPNDPEWNASAQTD